MVVIIIIGFLLFFIFSNYFLHFLIGDNSEWSKGDEMQKTIRQRASMGSWFTVIGYSLLSLGSSIPLFSSNNNLLINKNYYLDNGGDILIVAILGYAVTYIMEKYKMGKT